VAGGETIVRKKITAILLIGIIAAAVSTTLAAITLYLNMPMSVQVNPPVIPQLAFYVADQPWTNNTEVSWQNQTAGELQQKTFNIYNTGTIAAQVSINTVGMPSAFILTYSENGTTVQPQQWLNGTLTLTIPTDTVEGYYSWAVTVIAAP